MTIAEFVKEFGAIVPRYEWSGPVLRGDQDHHYFCPITALCWEKTGDHYDVGDFDNAAQRLGLDSLDAIVIMRAADRGRRAPLGRTLDEVETLRALLMSACNLPEEN